MFEARGDRLGVGVVGALGTLPFEPGDAPLGRLGFFVLFFFCSVFLMKNSAPVCWLCWEDEPCAQDGVGRPFPHATVLPEWFLPFPGGGGWATQTDRKGMDRQGSGGGDRCG